MQEWLDWLAKNREWVFSGVGISAITVIAIVLRKVFIPSKTTASSYATNHTTSGDRSLIISGNQGAVFTGDYAVTVSTSGENSNIHIDQSRHEHRQLYFIGEGELARELKRYKQALSAELDQVKTRTIQDKKRIQELEVALARVAGQLADIGSAHRKELERREQLGRMLESMYRREPSERIRSAIKALEQGQVREAEAILLAVHQQANVWVAKTAYLLGGIAESRFELQEAIGFYEEAVAHEPDNTNYLEAAANAYRGFDADKVLDYLRKGLEVLIAEWGGESLPVADCMEKLGKEYHQAGKYVQAIPLLEQVVEIRRSILGQRHPHMASSLIHLASAYDHQGEYGKALPLLEEALSIYRERLGQRHPYVATSLNNLASAYNHQGEYGKALPLHEEALSIYREQLGQRHPYVATSLNNLASAYDHQGEYGKALPLNEEALSIRREKLGDQHPHVASSLNNLALVYDHQGEYGKALPLLEEALSIRREKLGDRHPLVATSLNDLALVYEHQGEYGKALPLHEEALSIRREKLGDRHPDTLVSENNLKKCVRSCSGGSQKRV